MSQDFINWIKSLFRRNRTTESIIQPFSKVKQQLDEHRQSQLDAARRAEERAKELQNDAFLKQEEANRAAAAAEKVAAFLT